MCSFMLDESGFCGIAASQHALACVVLLLESCCLWAPESWRSDGSKKKVGPLTSLWRKRAEALESSFQSLEPESGNARSRQSLMQQWYAAAVETKLFEALTISRNLQVRSLHGSVSRSGNDPVALAEAPTAETRRRKPYCIFHFARNTRRSISCPALSSRRHALSQRCERKIL